MERNGTPVCTIYIQYYMGVLWFLNKKKFNYLHFTLYLNYTLL